MDKIHFVPTVISSLALITPAILTIISLGLFADVVTESGRDTRGDGDHCVLFAEAEEDFRAANRMCNSVIACQAVTLVLILTTVVALMVAVFVSK